MDRDELRRMANRDCSAVCLHPEELRDLLDALERAEADVSRMADETANLRNRCAMMSFEEAEALLMLEKAEQNEASLRRQLASRTEAIQTSLATTRELRERAENAERELASVDMILCVTGADDAFRCATLRAIRARLETAERERDAARAERDALRRHYDEAGPEHNLLALLDMYDERRAAAESERDEARLMLAGCRADLDMTAKERDENMARAEKAERERDEWKARHDTLADVSRATIATVERERDEARAERDARPDISIQTATDMVRGGFAAYRIASDAVDDAIRAHAAKAERERDEERHLADVRGEMLTKTERERDEAARMERVTSDVLERIKAALRMPHDGGSYVEWAETIRRAYDARPDISPEDAALHTGAVTFAESVGASQRIHAAIRAHAAKVKP